ELYRGRLERGLHAAMRQLRKLRDETAGEELSHDQQAEYAVDEFKRMIDQSKAVRLAKEELGIGKDSQSPKTNGANKANEVQAAGNSRRANEKREDDSMSIPAAHPLCDNANVPLPSVETQNDRARSS